MFKKINRLLNGTQFRILAEYDDEGTICYKVQSRIGIFGTWITILKQAKFNTYEAAKLEMDNQIRARILRSRPGFTADISEFIL